MIHEEAWKIVRDDPAMVASLRIAHAVVRHYIGLEGDEPCAESVTKFLVDAGVVDKNGDEQELNGMGEEILGWDWQVNFRDHDATPGKKG